MVLNVLVGIVTLQKHSIQITEGLLIQSRTKTSSEVKRGHTAVAVMVKEAVCLMNRDEGPFFPPPKLP